ncbi:MAG: hypothetical protein U0T82_11685 [Bacteroidales bacterium]
MKKSTWVFVITGMVLLTCIAWFASAQFRLSRIDLLQVAVLLMILGFAVFIGISRLKSERRGQPSEDELSRNIMRKASSVSYFISIYMWLGLMYFSPRLGMDSEMLIGTGILGMAILLAICYLVIYLKGLRDA